MANFKSLDENGSVPPKVPQPVTDSPWFWVYLFATAGLIALLLAGNKFDHRQSEIEREFSARQSYGHVLSGEDGPIAPPTPGNQHLTLRPLYLIMSIVLVVGWTTFYWKRMSWRADSLSQDSRQDGAVEIEQNIMDKATDDNID